MNRPYMYMPKVGMPIGIVMMMMMMFMTITCIRSLIKKEVAQVTPRQKRMRLSRLMRQREIEEDNCDDHADL